MHPPTPAPRSLKARALAAPSRSFAVSLAVLLALLAAACADHASEATAQAALAAAGADGVQIEEDGESVSYRTDAGEVTVTGGHAARLPADFPDDVYLPGDYIVESTLAMNHDLFIGLAAADDVPVLYAAAREAMAGHGWTETLAALENGKNGLLTFEKGERSAALSFSREAGRTSLGLQLTQRAP